MTAIAFEDIVWRDRRGRRVKLELRDGLLLRRDWRGRILQMASGKSNYLISALLNQIFNAAAFSFPSPLFAALWTATLQANSTGSTAGECSYTGYARVSITANTANFPTSSAGGAIQNATAITFGTNAGSLQTATFFALCDASSAGHILYWGSITSAAINPGNTPQVNINGLTASEA